MNKPNKIIIHHSLTDDGEVRDFDAIRRYHINVNGWKDIGYHYVIEKINGNYEIIKGRNENEEGAHTLGQNDTSIGICVVGNFDEYEPNEEQLSILVKLIKDIWNRYGELPIYGHKDFSNKSCPGIKFPIDKLKDMLKSNDDGVLKIKLENDNIINAIKINEEYYVKLSDVENLIKPLEVIREKQTPEKEEGENYMILKYGMRGEEVKKLQEKLNQLRYNTNGIDGIFGNGTLTAVKQFQQDNGLVIDGIVGENTWKIIESLLNKPNQKIKNKPIYKKIGLTHVLEVDPMDLHAEIIKERGDKIKGDFVNGTFFNYTNYTSTGNIVVNGKLLGKQQIYKNGKTWDYVKRGNFIVYKDGTVAVKMIMDIEKEEDISKIHFAISGFNMFPLDLKAEWFNPKEVGYQTWRTVLGYRKSDNKVIIAVRPSSTAERGQQTLINLGCDIGIGLDSGGSTNARFNGKTIRTTSRVLQNIIRWEV